MYEFYEDEDLILVVNKGLRTFLNAKDKKQLDDLEKSSSKFKGFIVIRGHGKTVYAHVEFNLIQYGEHEDKEIFVFINPGLINEPFSRNLLSDITSVESKKCNDGQYINIRITCKDGSVTDMNVERLELEDDLEDEEIQ